MDRRPVQTPSPASALTREEIDALLGSEASQAEDPKAILLVPSGPNRAMALRREFGAHGVPFVVCSTPYEALDLSRKRPWAALIADLAALPPNPDWYFARLRRVDPKIRLCFLSDGSPNPPPSEGPTFGWPLKEADWENLRRLVSAGAPPQPEPPGKVPERDSEPPPAVIRPPPQPDPNPPGPPTDPLRAVQTLLEALVDGETMREGVERWALHDPSIRGTVVVEDDPKTLRIDARANVRGERAGMVRALLESLGEPGRLLAETTSLGPFSVIPTSGGDAAPYVAVWHQDPETARKTLRRLGPVLDLIRRLERVSAPGATGGRDRFLALLASRMRAAQRRGGRLGIMIFESGTTSETLHLSRALRSALRGEDWIEVAGSRIYAILEEADQGRCRALVGRLKGLPRLQGLRIVALGWKPLEGSAEDLLDRAERLLAGSGGEPPAADRTDP